MLANLTESDSVWIIVNVVNVVELICAVYIGLYRMNDGKWEESFVRFFKGIEAFRISSANQA
jgi:hypothetical protein